MAVDVDFDFANCDRLIAALDNLAGDLLDSYRGRSTGAVHAQEHFRGTYARTFDVAMQEETNQAVSVARRCADEAAAWRSKRALAESERDELMQAERARRAETEDGQAEGAMSTNRLFL